MLPALRTALLGGWEWMRLGFFPLADWLRCAGLLRTPSSDVVLCRRDGRCSPASDVDVARQLAGSRRICCAANHFGRRLFGPWSLESVVPDTFANPVKS